MILKNKQKNNTYLFMEYLFTKKKFSNEIKLGWTLEHFNQKSKKSN